METELELRERQRIEIFKAKEPPIRWWLMPPIILAIGFLLFVGCGALGIERVYIWAILVPPGAAILSINSWIVRRRLEKLEEEHRIERRMLQGAIRAQRLGQ